MAKKTWVEMKRNEFSRIAKDYPHKTSQVVRKTAFDLRKAAAPFTPYETGTLAGSPEVQVKSTTFAIVIWGVHYAIYQNEGTRYIAGNFFAQKGAAVIKPTFVDAMRAIRLL